LCDGIRRISAFTLATLGGDFNTSTVPFLTTFDVTVLIAQQHSDVNFRINRQTSFAAGIAMCRFSSPTNDLGVLKKGRFLSEARNVLTKRDNTLWPCVPIGAMENPDQL
jgi:hypothetical protein